VGTGVDRDDGHEPDSEDLEAQSFAENEPGDETGDEPEFGPEPEWLSVDGDFPTPRGPQFYGPDYRSLLVRGLVVRLVAPRVYRARLRSAARPRERRASRSRCGSRASPRRSADDPEPEPVSRLGGLPSVVRSERRLRRRWAA
jgi:hypothetical protein